MRVGFDARLWQHTGIGRYIRNLLPRLSRKVAVVAWVAPEDVRAVQAIAPSAAVLPCPAKPFSIAEQIFWRRELRGRPVELFHAPHLNVPLSLPMPLVVTVHDLIPLRFPGTINSPLGQLYFSVMSRTATERAARVITDSQNTQRDLVELLGVADAKIRPVPLAADGRFGVPSESERLEAVRAHHGLRGPYLLYSGQWKRYKNLDTLLRAFAAVRTRHPELQLVLIGREDARQGHVPALIEQLGLGPAVVRTGHVAEETDLVALYQGAAAFVFPSRYEGFGLPPLEAMAAGVPVVSSNAASLPEVVGEAGLLVPPDDVAGWEAAIERVLAEPGLRDQLVSEGLARAAGFDWAETAERTLAVYREAIAPGQGV